MVLKKIQAIIRVSKFENVKAALQDFGVETFTYADVSGVSFLDEKKGSYRGFAVTEAGAIPRKSIEIIVPEIDAMDIVERIKKVAATGIPGDGKIFVSTIDEAVHISI